MITSRINESLAPPIQTMQEAKAKNNKRGKELGSDDLLSLAAQTMAMSFNPMDESGGNMNVGDMFDNLVKMKQISSSDKTSSALEDLVKVMRSNGALAAIGKEVTTEPISLGPESSAPKSITGTVVSFTPNADGGMFKVQVSGNKTVDVSPDQVLSYGVANNK